MRRKIKFKRRLGYSSGLAHPAPNGIFVGLFADSISSARIAFVVTVFGCVLGDSNRGSGISAENGVRT